MQYIKGVIVKIEDKRSERCWLGGGMVHYIKLIFRWWWKTKAFDLYYEEPLPVSLEEGGKYIIEYEPGGFIRNVTRI